MTSKIYSRKTKGFLAKNSKKVVEIKDKASNLSFKGIEPFKEAPSRKVKDGKNVLDSMNAFDLFQAYTCSIIHKNIIYGR